MRRSDRRQCAQLRRNRTPLAVAYEPLWAIGTGHMPAANEIVEMHAHIRQCLTMGFGAAAGKGPEPLRGVGQTVQCARDPGLADVGGGLIGGARLKVADFDAIIRAAE